MANNNDKKGVRYLILNGLGIILPLLITIALVSWLLSALEHLFAPMVRTIIPESWYFPGMGIVIGLALLMAVSILL